MSDYSTQKSQKIVDKNQKNPTKESGNPINSRSNSFLRSLKSSKQYKSSETELEEGETISPSPSPRHTSIKVPDKSRDTARRESAKEKDRSPSRLTSSSRRREDTKRSNARQDYRSSRHDSDNDSGSRRRSSSDRKRDKGYRSSRYHSRSRSTSRSRTPPRRRSRNRSESSRRRSPPSTSTTSRSEKSITNGNGKNPDNDSHNNKRKRSPRERRDSSMEKSGTTPSRTLTPTRSSSYVKGTNDRNTKPKTISATAPDSDTPEQCKLFVIMFSKLAHANKRRGDNQTEEFFGMIDHFHALCDYILNFYYVDKTSVDKLSFKQASQAWKSLFPFTDSLLAKLESHQHYDLYGLCARLISLVRYYIYKRMIDQTRHLLGKQLALDDEQDSSSSRVCIQVSESLLREYEKAERWYRTSEKYLSYGTMATQFPQTFKHVCMEGDLSAGITLGGEAGVSVEPMFPFTPYSPLHHAAIVSKCMLSEYVRTKKFDYTPISQPEEYMK
ncbi:MFS domain-containing protein [Mucor velutinosus]|uniref:MFS domain-containing protein n=1 Tax=Mucor velutinosus TaxID=708070 RepID=A0AAN7D8U1_9FUNG|nr:MFS domain-containing protein [Mucor velutinosus]